MHPTRFCVCFRVLCFPVCSCLPLFCFCSRCFCFCFVYALAGMEMKASQWSEEICRRYVYRLRYFEQFPIWLVTLNTTQSLHRTKGCMRNGPLLRPTPRPCNPPTPSPPTPTRLRASWMCLVLGSVRVAPNLPAQVLRYQAVLWRVHGEPSAGEGWG